MLLAATAKAYRRLPLAATARAYWQVRLVGLVLLLVQVPVKPKVVLALAPSVPYSTATSSPRWRTRRCQTPALRSAARHSAD